MAKSSDELMRMALTGLDPVLVARIRTIAEKIIRESGGAPEDVPGFQEAQRALRVLAAMDRP